MSSGYVRDVLAAAEQLGFTLAERHTGTGHLLLVHTNGGKVTLPCTPSEYRGKANAIAQLERVAGRRLPRPNHRRSRKAVQVSGYSNDAAARECQQWHAEHDAKVADLLAQRDALIEECRRLAGDRARLRDIPARLDVITRIEDHLGRMAQPVEPFDPYTLAPN